ncbi:MAG: 6-bladed beta-propeller [Bacteroidota bacterium]
MKSFKLLLIILIIASCKVETNEETLSKLKIDLSQSREVKLSEFVSELKYVKLQTENIPLGEGLVKLRDQHIYYWDFQQKIICVFNHNGKLVSKLDKVGQGPGEYTFPIHFDVLDDEKMIEIWDKSKGRIIRYNNLNFELIEEIPIQNMITFTSSIKLSNTDYLLSANQALNIVNDKKTNAEFYLFDSNGKLKDTYFDRLYKDEDKKDIIRYSLFKFKLINDDYKNTYASVNYDNKLYRYKNDGFKPILEVDFVNGNSVNNEELLKMSKVEHMQYFTKSSDFVKTASFPNFEIYNEKVTLVNYMFKESLGGFIDQRSFISLKNLNQTINAKSIVNDLTNFPANVKIGYTDNDTYIHCNPWYKDHFVSVISPEAIMDYGQKVKIDQIGELTALDNPIILFMKLKQEK